MTDYTQIIDTINENVYENTTGKVTATGLNNTLQGIVSTVQSVDNSKQDVLTIDVTPVDGSTNPVQSGGVYTMIQQIPGSNLVEGDNIIIDLGLGTTISTTLTPKFNIISTTNNKLAITLVDGTTYSSLMFGNGNTIIDTNIGLNYMFGINNTINSAGSHNFIQGNSNIINGDATNGFIQGSNNTIVDGNKSVIFGNSNSTNSLSSFVVGNDNDINGNNNYVFGDNIEVTGCSYSMFVGNYIKVPSGSYNFIQGSDNGSTYASSNNTVFGMNNHLTKNSSTHNFICGSGNTVKSDYSTVLGSDNTCNANYSLVVGTSNTLQETGINSFISGNNNNVTGADNIICGDGNTVIGNCSVTFGHYNYNENGYALVVGRYNYDDSGLFQIGNGTSTSDRKNIFSVSANGKVTTGYNTLSTDDNKVLATKGYVDNECLLDLVTGTQASINPNSYCILGSISTFPTILTANKVINKVNEYSGRFTCSTVFTLPTTDDNSINITWYGATTLTQGSLYEFSIIEGIGIINELI